MNTLDALVDDIRPLAKQISAIYEDAARCYAQEVDCIVRSDSHDVKHIESPAPY